MSENGLIGRREYRMGKPRTVTDVPLRRNQPLELLGKLHKADDTETRRVLVEQTNPFFYVFGERRRAWKPWLTYMENMETQYIGERA